MTFPPFRLDVVNQCLWRGDTRIELTPKPFAVLRHLVEHAGRLVTHDELLSAVWPNTYVQPEVLRRYILEIRRVLGDEADSPRFIETLPKRGYQFIARVSSDLPETALDAITRATTLVGRGQELADLHRHLEKAKNGQRQIVFVVGEHGIGKTSLVDAFQAASAASVGVLVARGQSVEGFGGKEAYYPVLEALGQLARSTMETLVVGTLTSSAPTWLVQFPSLVRPEQLAALQRELLGATRERMVRELCEALEVIARTVALVVVLEDLHWADRSTVDLLSAIARRREPAKLFMLGTFRPADLILSESPLKALRQDLLVHRLSSEVPLERLGEGDVADYLATEFAPSDFPEGLAAVIHEQSDGNPLFLTAMVDHLVQKGVLVQASGRWTITVPLEEVDPGVPETLKQMLELQLQHLSGEHQQLLKSASVAGQTFSAWAVATMLARDLIPVEESCAALADRQQFLRSSGLRELPDGAFTPTYTFKHALYREVLYRQLPHVQRVTFHRSLAEGLERLHAPEAPEMAAEVALHFEEGHEVERAIRYLLVAAQNATRRYAHAEAIAVLQHAQELLPRVALERRRELDLLILDGIGSAFYALGDMRRSSETYSTMATRAAEAGLLATQASALMRLTVETIPFFQKAIELDPDFALAYTSLSRIYSTLGEAERARAYAKLAYECRDKVSGRERLSITYQYHYDVTGNQALANQTLEEWKQAFPDEFQPVNSLALINNFLGRFERAVEEGNEAVRRNPSHGFPYSNLAHAYRGLGRFDEARKTAERAVALNIETLPTRRLLYQLAVIAGDLQGAERHVDWARDRAREFEIAGARAQVAGYFGRIRESRKLYEDTVRMSEERNLPDVGSGHLAWATWMELVYGNVAWALEQARRVLARNPSYDPLLRVALILASTGSTGEAESIAADLVRITPDHTLINSVLVPIVRAGIELGKQQPQRAIEQLAAAAPYELGFVAVLAPIYLRAQAYLKLGAGLRAAEEFQRILDHRGSDPFSPFCAVASAGRARSLTMIGDVEGSRRAYEQFLTAWRDADSDVPILLEAREEYSRLKRL